MPCRVSFSLVILIVAGCAEHHEGTDSATLDGARDAGSDSPADAGTDTPARLDAGTDAMAMCERRAGTVVELVHPAFELEADTAYAAHSGYDLCDPAATLWLFEGDEGRGWIDLELGESTSEGFVPWEPPFEQEVGILVPVDDIGFNLFGILRVDELTIDYTEMTSISIRGELLIEDERGGTVVGPFNAGYCPRFDSVCL